MRGATAAQKGGMNPKAMRPDESTAGSERSICPDKRPRGVHDEADVRFPPSASRLAPAMSSGISSRSQIASMHGHMYSSQTMASARKTSSSADDSRAASQRSAHAVRLATAAHSEASEACRRQQCAPIACSTTATSSTAPADARAASASDSIPRVGSGFSVMRGFGASFAASSASKHKLDLLAHLHSALRARGGWRCSKGVTDSAGILEVLGNPTGLAFSTPTASVSSLIPTDETVASRLLEPAGKTPMSSLAAVDEYLKARNADAVFRPLVLIPAGAGEGSARGKDARSIARRQQRSARRELDTLKLKPKLIVGACKPKFHRSATRGTCFVVRFFHDTANPADAHPSAARRRRCSPSDAVGTSARRALRTLARLPAAAPATRRSLMLASPRRDLCQCAYVAPSPAVFGRR